MPGEFLAVDVRGCGCAVGVEFHAMHRDVFLFWGEEFGVPWGVGEEGGSEEAEEDGDASFDDENEWPEFF